MLKGAVNLNKGKLRHSKTRLLCLFWVMDFLMRDILDDDERGVKPLGLLMLTTATVLSGMIIYNMTFGQTQNALGRTNVTTAPGASTHVEVPAPAEGSNTVVFKYDATVEEVQRELLATGHFKGLVDGVNGQKTKLAIEQFQQEIGLPVTGQITSDLVGRIQYTRKVKAASEYTGSVDPAPVAILNAQSLAAAVAPVAAAPEPEVAVAEPVSAKPKKPPQNNNILSVQKTLSAKGYAVGGVTGKMNAETRAAILQYELENGLAMDGIINSTLLAALGSGK
jgi:peptidoglycan hydrolase-like protein with peptidoglycan-binding domain